ARTGIAAGSAARADVVVLMRPTDRTCSNVNRLEHRLRPQSAAAAGVPLGLVGRVVEIADAVALPRIDVEESRLGIVAGRRPVRSAAARRVDERSVYLGLLLRIRDRLPLLVDAL